MGTFTSEMALVHQGWAEKLHTANVAAGWWNDLHTGEKLNRNVGELLCLVHSEVSESWDAYCSGDNDDKLPHHKGYKVELADACIRIYDIAGFYHFDFHAYTRKNSDWDLANSEPEALYLDIHLYISHAMEGNRKGNGPKFEASLLQALDYIYLLAEKEKIDLQTPITEKAAFNASRADHKPENRRLEGGKAY